MPDSDEYRLAMKRLNDLLEYASSKGIAASLDLYDDGEDVFDDEDPGSVVLQIPNGRFPREFTVDAFMAPELIGKPLDEVVVLGNLSAMLNPTSGDIEALVNYGRGGSPFRTVALWRLPGAEDLDGDEDGGREGIPRKWRLRIQSGAKVIEFSPASSLFSGLFTTNPRATTLKLSGFGALYHDDALEVLEQQARTIFFDIDVMFNIPVRLSRQISRSQQRLRLDVEHALDFPANEYAAEALDLYLYGRAADGLPLLEFLAYYQALEYFFPSFAHEETTKAIRTALANPRFNRSSDSDIASLITMATPAVRAGVGEREQLRSTIRAAVTRDGLRAFIEDLGEVGDQFSAKKQAIRGLSPVPMSSQEIRELVADRIYTIRCRVVHTKQDGGSTGEEMLLPNSPEADALGPEIALVRYLAQQAIFARAQRATSRE